MKNKIFNKEIFDDYSKKCFEFAYTHSIAFRHYIDISDYLDSNDRIIKIKDHMFDYFKSLLDNKESMCIQRTFYQFDLIINQTNINTIKTLNEKEFEDFIEFLNGILRESKKFILKKEIEPGELKYYRNIISEELYYPYTLRDILRYLEMMELIKLSDYEAPNSHDCLREEDRESFTYVIETDSVDGIVYKIDELLKKYHDEDDSEYFTKLLFYTIESNLKCLIDEKYSKYI